MKNVIFGSGVVGLLAKYILGDDWTVVPFYRSRFYSHNPPLCDNYIIADKDITPVVAGLGLPTVPVLYRRSFSVGGQLLSADPGGVLARDWLNKIFDGAPPGQAEAYTKTRMSFFVYDVRVNRLYQSLLQRYQREIMAEAARGQVTEVGDHYLVRGGVREDFDRAVSTVPLALLMDLLRIPHQLRFKPVQLLHVQTGDLDFEGSNQALVVDPVFSFFKATMLGKGRYLLHCHQEIPHPGSYLMPILKDFELLDGTRVDDMLPLGNMPDLKFLEPYNIFPVGAYAQHDWCADVGSNCLRLLRYASRSFTPAVPRAVSPR